MTTFQRFVSLFMILSFIGLGAACKSESGPTGDTSGADDDSGKTSTKVGDSAKPAGSSTGAALTAVRDQVEAATVDKSNPGWKSSLTKPTVVAFDDDEVYYWNLETNVGDIKVRLMPDVAPMHVTSTIYLTELGFYDGISFHRVIPGFMAQGGCPQGSGRGNPGYKYAGEFDPTVVHDRPGLLSMANAGPNTDGSQFFLTFVPTPHLDGKHTIFGEVVEGMSTVKALEAKGSRRGTPSSPLSIDKATITVE